MSTVYPFATLQMEFCTPDGKKHPAKYLWSESLDFSNVESTLMVSPTLLSSPLNPTFDPESNDNYYGLDNFDAVVWERLNDNVAYFEAGYMPDGLDYSISLQADVLAQLPSEAEQLAYINQKAKQEGGQGPQGLNTLSFRVTNPIEQRTGAALTLHVLSTSDTLRAYHSKSGLDHERMLHEAEGLILTDNADYAALLKHHYPQLGTATVHVDALDLTEFDEDILIRSREPLLNLLLRGATATAQVVYDIDPHAPFQSQLESTLRFIPAPDAVIQDLRQIGRNNSRALAWLRQISDGTEPAWVTQLRLTHSSQQPAVAPILIDPDQLVQSLPMIPLKPTSHLVEKKVPGHDNTLIFHAFNQPPELPYASHQGQPVVQELLASYTVEPDGRLALTTDPHALDAIRLHQLPQLDYAAPSHPAAESPHPGLRR